MRKKLETTLIPGRRPITWIAARSTSPVVERDPPKPFVQPPPREKAVPELVEAPVPEGPVKPMAPGAIPGLELPAFRAGKKK